MTEPINHGKPYTAAENVRLLEAVNGATHKALLAERFGRTEHAIKRHVDDLKRRASGRKPRPTKFFSDAEDALIIRDHNKRSMRDIGKELGRSKGSISGRIYRLRKTGKIPCQEVAQ